jgi:hypothetical protein
MLPFRWGEALMLRSQPAAAKPTRALPQRQGFALHQRRVRHRLHRHGVRRSMGRVGSSDDALSEATNNNSDPLPGNGSRQDPVSTSRGNPSSPLPVDSSSPFDFALGAACGYMHRLWPDCLRKPNRLGEGVP